MILSARVRRTTASGRSGPDARGVAQHDTPLKIAKAVVGNRRVGEASETGINAVDALRPVGDGLDEVGGLFNGGPRAVIDDQSVSRATEHINIVERELAGHQPKVIGHRFDLHHQRHRMICDTGTSRLNLRLRQRKLVYMARLRP